jgi:ATP-dependent exoDNAse (exonuclease V) beta subunit
MLGQQQDAKSEYPLTVVTSKKTQSLVVDRTFVDSDGNRWIIDYKTAMPSSGESVDSFLASQEAAYLEQLKAYKSAFSIIDKRPIRLGLYFPALPAWREVIAL